MERESEDRHKTFQGQKQRQTSEQTKAVVFNDKCGLESKTGTEAAQKIGEGEKFVENKRSPESYDA